MRFVYLLLLLPLGGTLVLTLALDQLEIDDQVAPPSKPRPVATNPTLQLWRSFVGQVRQALHRLRPTVRSTTTSTTSTTTTTRQPMVLLRSNTTEPELQYYGALNPIFQMR